MAGLFSSGGRTRTCDLRVMSPTSYQLLYPAMWNAKVGTFFGSAKFFFKMAGRPLAFEPREQRASISAAEALLLSGSEILHLHGTGGRLRLSAD